MPATRSSPSGSVASLQSRTEDPRLLTGRGRYVSDIHPDGALHGVFLRSEHPRARIVKLDTVDARAMEGVVAIVIGADLQGLELPAPNPLLAGIAAPSMPLLPLDSLGWVGQPIALVIARTALQARDAAEAVMLECEPMDAVADLAPAAATAVEVRHHTADAPVSAACHVRVVHTQPRVSAAPLEPRAAVLQWDGSSDRLIAHLQVQAPARARADLARVLGLEPARVRVVAPDVGGAFGARSSLGHEEFVLAWAARRLGATVRWSATRSEEFTAGVHGRGAQMAGSLHLDAHGRFLHLEADMRFPLGAWLPFSAVVPARNAARILPGPYRVDGIDVAASASCSDAAAVTIYRGAGRPEAALLMEHLVERAARALRIDPIELRRRNLVAAERMPYATPTGETLDSGDYLALLERAAQAFGWEGEQRARDARRASGELVGIGTALYVEPCGQGWESARVTVESDGRVTVASGSSAQGQGHETSYAEIAAGALRCDPSLVTVLQGDTDRCPEGIGALASRSIAIGGSAVLLAARQAQRRRASGEPLPLTEEVVYTAPMEAWGSGCVIVRLAVDRCTGRPTIERIVWVDDAGHVVSPQLVRGQLLGGLAQGLGQALCERIAYDDRGQILTGSLMDYALPRADDVPAVELFGLEGAPTIANALGAKGVGEAGCIGVPAAILNAAADALSAFGEPDLDFPLTAERLWRAMGSPA